MKARYAYVQPSLRAVSFVYLRPSRRREALHAVIAGAQEACAEDVDYKMDTNVGSFCGFTRCFGKYADLYSKRTSNTSPANDRCKKTYVDEKNDNRQKDEPIEAGSPFLSPFAPVVNCRSIIRILGDERLQLHTVRFRLVPHAVQRFQCRAQVHVELQAFLKWQRAYQI